MKLRSTLLSITMAAVLGLGVAVVPVVAAEAKAKPSLTVQLMTPSGKKLHQSGVEIYVHGSKYYSIAHTNKSGLATIKYFPKTSKLVVETWSKSGKYLEVVKKKVKIKTGKTTKLSLKYAVGATISGTITDPDGQPVGGTEVAAITPSGNFVGFAKTTSSGSYKIVGLKSGSYRLQFNSRDGVLETESQQRWGWSYWGGATSIDGAVAVKVHHQSKKKATATKGISGVLPAAATVSGSTSVYLGSDHSLALAFLTDTYEDSAYVGLDSGYASFTQALNEAVYYPAILDRKTRELFWYTGDYTPVSTDGNLAVPVTVDGVNNQSINISSYSSTPPAGAQQKRAHAPVTAVAGFERISTAAPRRDRAAPVVPPTLTELPGN